MSSARVTDASAGTVEIRDLGSFDGLVVRGSTEARSALELGQLDGARVAVVGPGARLAPDLRRLAARPAATKVFHTEPAWILPYVPGTGMVARAGWSALPHSVDRRATEMAARAHLRRHVRDPWERRQLTPTSAPTRHNVAHSNSFYRCLRKVELIHWPVAGACPEGLRTADGIEHHVDVIVVL